MKITDPVWDQVSLPTKLGGFGIRKTTELAISGYLSSVSAVEQGVKDLLDYDPYLTPLHMVAQIPTLVGDGLTAFHEASLENSQEVGLTQLHLDDVTSIQHQDDGDINSTSNFGVTPLHDAAKNDCGSYFELVKRLWKNKVGNSAEFPKNPKIQKEWDLKMCQSTFDRLMEAASNSPHERAHLMAVSSKNASDWLNCIPIPSLGLKLNPSQLKIASALRLGAPVCRPFKCFHCSLNNDYYVVPIGIETLGSFGPHALDFIKDIGHRITESTGEKKSTSYLMQTIGMAIQRGNSSCILETVLDSEKLDGVYYL